MIGFDRVIHARHQKMARGGTGIRSAALATLAALGCQSALAQPKFAHPDRIRYDSHCFTIEGKDVFLYSGAFHYFRCPKELWPARLKAIKDAGFNAIETYVAWNWSEQEKPRDVKDFSHIRLNDFDEFLTMAEEQFGLYTIIRPGPYICAEWASGGFPNWLPAFKPASPKRPMWYRSDDPVFEAWSHHWFDAVAKVVARHQLTHKKKGEHGVILWQVENEYGDDSPGDNMKRNYVRDLIERTRHDGIDVPIFTCWTSAVRDPKGDPILSDAFDNPNEYPRWNIQEAVNGIRDQHNAEPWAPKMVTEFQGGWFGQVGGLAAEEQSGVDDRQINALTLWSIGNGMAALNYYMLFGGTNFGDWAGEGITSSYDYNAPIREWGGGGPKYRVVKAIGEMLAKYGRDLARSDLDISGPKDQGAVRIVTREGATGARYEFCWNTNREAPADVDPGTGIKLALPPFGCNVFRYSLTPADGKWIVQVDSTPSKFEEKRIRIPTADVAELHPIHWRPAPADATSVGLGIYDSRFITFRNPPDPQHYLWVKSAGSELISSEPPLPGKVQGGQVWSPSAQERTFLLVNPGWPNGGPGMEQPHGISDARVLDHLPASDEFTGWKMKMLDDPADRSLTKDEVDTTGWVEGVQNDLFLPNTTGVIRAEVDIPSAPDRNLLLQCEGVDDEGWFYVNGQLAGEVHSYNVPITMKVATLLHPGRNHLAIVIHNIGGAGGLTGQVRLTRPMDGKPASMEWTDEYRGAEPETRMLNMQRDLPIYDHPSMDGKRSIHADRLTKSTLRFDRPDPSSVWEIVLAGGGDGFVFLNGHPLGRYWERGPQRAYFLPDPWLRSKNQIDVVLSPGRLGDAVSAAELRSLPMGE